MATASRPERDAASAGARTRRPPTAARRTRRSVARLHRWIGLGAGLLGALSGLTGAALVFRVEADAALDARLLRAAPPALDAARAPLQSLVDAAARAYPASPAPFRVRMPRTPEGTIEVWLGAAPERYVYVDPWRGTVLGARRPDESVMGWLFLLHTHLLSGRTGERIVGTGGIALALLSLTGLWAWWPGRGRVRGALRVVTTAGPARTTYDVHRVVGFWGSALLLVAGVTGASLVFKESFERAAYVVSGTPAKPRAPRVAARPDDGPPLPADSLLAVAERALPGGVVTYVYLADGPGTTFRVRKRLPGELHPNGRSMVTLDPRGGAVLRVEDGTRAPRGARLYAALYPLHIGVVGGLPTRLLAVVVGLLPATLGVTGTLIWWRRARRHSRS